MVKYFRLTVPPKELKKDFNNHAKGPSIIWIRKHDKLNVEKCSPALQSQSIRSDWYFDNGCSMHMAGHKNIFISLNKERDGSVSFVNENSTKIIGKCIVKLGSKDSKEKNALLVENMKHNLISVSQMSDQGHRIIFDLDKCEIRNKGLGKLVATTIRTSSNTYILNEIGKERCYLGKKNESFLWLIRMGHMNFDNMVKISRKEPVREIPEISKPASTMCKHCLHGKQTRT